MRAWLPEQQVVGPERATERDLEDMNRVFAEAFTDRYRRDGLVGVRVPPLNPIVWRYALLDAAEGALVWRDERGRVAAFNIAHRSGVEGWMGPLAVRPTARAWASARRSSARPSTGSRISASPPSVSRRCRARWRTSDSTRGSVSPPGTSPSR